MTEQNGTKKVADLIEDIRVAMLTYPDLDGRLVSHPMTTQEVEFDGDVLFIAERDSGPARAIEAATPARVNVAYASQGTWVSVAGTATVEDDPEKLRELWDTFTDAWLEGGPDSPNTVLIHIAAESAEYWDSPGAKVTQLANLVKAKVTGDRVEGENRVVEL